MEKIIYLIKEDRMLFISIFVIALGFIIMSEVKQVILIFLMMKYITLDELDLHP